MVWTLLADRRRGPAEEHEESENEVPKTLFTAHWTLSLLLHHLLEPIRGRLGGALYQNTKAVGIRKHDATFAEVDVRGTRELNSFVPKLLGQFVDVVYDERYMNAIWIARAGADFDSGPPTIEDGQAVLLMIETESKGVVVELLARLGILGKQANLVKLHSNSLSVAELAFLF
jgi:hypothetical protein